MFWLWFVWCHWQLHVCTAVVGLWVLFEVIWCTDHSLCSVQQNDSFLTRHNHTLRVRSRGFWPPNAILGGLETCPLPPPSGDPPERSHEIWSKSDGKPPRYDQKRQIWPQKRVQTSSERDTENFIHVGKVVEEVVEKVMKKFVNTATDLTGGEAVTASTAFVPI